MKRRSFLKNLALGAALGAAAAALATVASACASLVNPNAGQPWRCTNCGHFERSSRDLSYTRCPRCYDKAMVKITEEELQQHLAGHHRPAKA